MKKIFIFLTFVALFNASAFAQDQTYKVNLVNLTNNIAQAFPVDTFGTPVCNYAPVTVGANSHLRCSADYTFTSGGSFQNQWQIGEVTIPCPLAFLPDNINGQTFSFLLRTDRSSANGYICTQTASLQKHKRIK